MKNILKITLLGLILSTNTISVRAQTKNFSIEVNFKEADENFSVFLLRFKDIKGWDSRFEPIPFDTIAKKTARNGKVKFSADIALDGTPFAISISRSKLQFLLLPSKEEKIVINSEIGKWPQAEVIGSKGTRDMLEYQRFFTTLIEETKTAEVAAFRAGFLRENPNSIYSAYVILLNDEMSAEDRINSFKALTPYVRNCFFGKKIADAIENRKLVQIKEKDVGSSLPDFIITCSDGRQQSIRQLVEESKYTLIDFWASWCAPCVGDLSKLKKTYDTFHDKGFNIIGVSTDKKKTDWEKALKDHPTPWVHGIDNVEQASKGIFGLYAIPGYILVNRQGNIIQTSYFTGPGMKSLRRGEMSLSRDLFKIVESLIKKDEQ